jgi:hypothetical protein
LDGGGLAVPNLCPGGSMEEWVWDGYNLYPRGWSAYADAVGPAHGRPGSYGQRACRVEAWVGGSAYLDVYTYNAVPAAAEADYTVGVWYSLTGDDVPVILMDQDWTTLATATLPATGGAWRWLAIPVATDTGDSGLAIEFYLSSATQDTVLLLDDVMVWAGTVPQEAAPEASDPPPFIPDFASKSDGDVPIWNASLGIWEPGAPGGGSLPTLTDGPAGYGTSGHLLATTSTEDGWEWVDASAPGAHHTAHESGGADSIKLDDFAAPDDNTDLNVSTSAHGLTPKAPNDKGLVLRGDAAWKRPTRIIAYRVYAEAGAWTSGDGVAYIPIPAALDGYDVTAVTAMVETASTSGTPTVQLARDRGGAVNDMLSTRITLDANERSSDTAATAPVINTSYDDLDTGDRIRVDIDGTGTGTKGLTLFLTVTAE